MAHQQLPLNSLGVGGSSSMDPASSANTNSRYQMSSDAGAFSDLSLMADAADQNHHRLNSSEFNAYAPPPYPGQMDDRFVHDTSGQCSSSLSSVLSPQSHSMSGSLPPITSFGIRHQSPMAQLANIGGSTAAASTVALPSTSAQSSAACSPSSSSQSQYNQHNNHHHNHHFPTTMNAANQPVQRHNEPTTQTAGPSPYHSQQFLSGMTVQLENHFQPQHQQQMHSPAFSAHLASSISNPGSIVSAPPESPSNMRSPSVRSTHSLRMINSTPDPFQQNNTGSEHHSHSLESLVQDGQIQQQMAESGNNNFPLARQAQKTPHNAKQAQKRAYTPRTQRMKTPGLPFFQMESPSPIAPMLGSPSSGEGPTVRQHLQQQQAAQKQRRQQELMLKRMNKEPVATNNPELTRGNSNDQKPQVESAPPSVAFGTASLDGFGPSPSFSIHSSDSAHAVQKAPVSTTPLHHILAKADSLSPPKRSTANRARTSGQGQRKLGGQLSGNGAASSAEALASTIASVASGGGSLEEFEKFSTTPLVAVTTASSSCSPSTSVLSSAQSTPGPSNVPTAILEPNFTPSPSLPKRRKTAAAVSTSTQKLSPLVLATSTPSRQLEAGEYAESLAERKFMEIPTVPHQFRMSPIKQPSGPPLSQQQQCRIHVQNPPPHSGDFPMTGTKIQVVHMQPSPVSSGLSASASPQMECSPRQFTANMLPSRPGSELMNALQSQPSPFIAPQSAGSVGDPSDASGSGMMCSPRGMIITSALPPSPYHGTPPQPMAPARQHFFAPPTPGTSIQHQQDGNTYAIMERNASPMGSPFVGNPTMQMIQSPQQQQMAHQQQAGFQHPNVILNRQPQQQPPQIGAHQNVTKYSPASFRQQPPVHQNFSANSPAAAAQLSLGRPTPSPHQPQVPYSPMAMGASAAPPPPPTPTMVASPQMIRFHQQQQSLRQSPLMAPPSQTPPSVGAQMGMSQQIQSPMSSHMAFHQIQQQSPQEAQYQQFQQHNRQPAVCMSPAATMVAPNQQPGMQHLMHLQHQSTMQTFPPQHQQAVPQQHAQTAYMPPVTPLQQQQQTPHLQQLLHQQMGHPAQIGPFTTAAATASSPGPHHQQQQRIFATPVGPSACATPSSVQIGQAPPTPHPRAQLSRAQLLSRHARELECQKYSVKLYHLQRTMKALVYKNGALADELARLNQRIHVVTEERKILAKRLQHHERNRIRRIQTQFRKAAAAAAAAAAKEDPTLVAGTSGEDAKIGIKKECIDDEEGLLSNNSGMQGTSSDIRQDQEGIGPALLTLSVPNTIPIDMATTSVAVDGTVDKQDGAYWHYENNQQGSMESVSLLPQIQLNTKLDYLAVNAQQSMEQHQQPNSSCSFSSSSFMVSPNSDAGGSEGGINGGQEHQNEFTGEQRPIATDNQMMLRSRTVSSNSSSNTAGPRELSISPAGNSKGKGHNHEQQQQIRSRQSMRNQRQPYELRSSRSRSSDQQQKTTVQTANIDEQQQKIPTGNATKCKAWDSDGVQPSTHQTPVNSTPESATKQASLVRNSTTIPTMTTRRQSLAKHGNSTATQTAQSLDEQMNCHGMAQHNSGPQKVPAASNDQHDRRRTASTAAAMGSQRRS